MSVRAMTQAITIAMGMEMPWTNPVTTSVFKKALAMPGSLNAAMPGSKAVTRRVAAVALQSRHEQKIDRADNTRKAKRTRTTVSKTAPGSSQGDERKRSEESDAECHRRERFFKNWFALGRIACSQAQRSTDAH